MTGKDKCKMLKDIRRKIAEDNDINIVVSECKYQGDCKGTCPKCEAELAELERKLRNKKLVVGAAVTTGVVAATVGVGVIVSNHIKEQQISGDEEIVTEAELMGAETIYDIEGMSKGGYMEPVE